MSNLEYVRRFGKYTLSRHVDGEYCLSDGWLCDWFILYPSEIGGGWAHDGRFPLRKDIFAWFNKVSPKTI